VRFGVSTQLYHRERLSRAHLAEVAEHGFDTIEIIATRTHVDYHDPDALAALTAWLGDTGLRLHSIHAPIAEAVINGRWSAPLSNASADETVRRRAVAETLAALEIARHVPVGVLVVHLGLPTSLLGVGEANSRDAARRSLNEIVEVARPLGVGVALENIPGDLATPDAVVALIEDEDLARHKLGACLDFGHAHMMAGVPDAIEAFSGVLAATHLHDNHGTQDEHLPPFEGTIDWVGALMALQKIGYDGVMMVEVASDGSPSGEVLARVGRACARMEAETRSWS
jgi:sugar phosphate isomerase/epimerase